MNKLFVVVAASALCTSAWAQGPGGRPVMVKCKDDIAKFCADKQHVMREARTCLEAHKDSVSAECKQALESTGPGQGRMQGQGKGQPPPQPK